VRISGKSLTTIFLSQSEEVTLFREKSQQDKDLTAILTQNMGEAKDASWAN